nr:hypothetical protein [Effusibacillus lacus]
MAQAHGYEDYPLIEVFHPISNRTSESLKLEAERVLEDTVRLLVKK